MATMHLGQPRTYYAGVNVNRGKFRGLSEADEALMEVITNPGRKHEIEIPQEDLELLDQKFEAGMYTNYGAKAANYGSSLAGAGAEFTPTSVAGQIIDQVNLLSKVRGNHQLFHASSDPFVIPLNKSTITVKFVAPGQTDGAAAQLAGTQTGELSVQHAKLIAATTMSTEFEEDSVKASMAFLKRHMGVAIARAEENEIFFNDKATPNASITGMHQAAVLKTTTGDVTPQDIMDGMTLNMDKKYMGDSEDLVLYMDVLQYRKMQSNPNVATVDKYGPKATMLTGEISRVWGIPIAVTDQLANDKAILVYRPALVISQRRALTLRSFPVADDQTRIEATVRVNIGWPYGTGASAKVAVRFAAS